MIKRQSSCFENWRSLTSCAGCVPSRNVPRFFIQKWNRTSRGASGSVRDGNIAGILGRPVAQGLFLDPAQLPPVKKRGDQRWYRVGDGFRPEGGRRTEGGGQSEQGREIDSLSEEGQGEGIVFGRMETA